jgi:hypothetical protein
MIRTFTGVILEARAAAVPLVSPNRFCLALSPQIKSIKAQKMAGSVSGKTAGIHRIGWSSEHITILFGTSIGVWATQHLARKSENCNHAAGLSGTLPRSLRKKFV